MKPVLVQFADDLVARIDQARGDVPRAVWIRRACERAVPGADGEPTNRGLPITSSKDDDGGRLPVGAIKQQRNKLTGAIVGQQRLARYDGDRPVWEEVQR